MSRIALEEARAVAEACRGAVPPTNERVLVPAAVTLLETGEVERAAVVVLWLRALLGIPADGAAKADRTST